ncbi:hypothetical protein ACHAQJ_006335 [Trichoderma viride]
MTNSYPEDSKSISEFTPGELLMNFTRAPYMDVDEKTWNIEPPLPLWSLYREFTNSSLGILDRLPPEIIQIILHFLDFQSLTRFARTSGAAFDLVQHLPAYIDLFRYAPRLLTALAKSKLLKYHASSLLRHVLRNDGVCCSCKNRFGGYIFLPTADRVCLLCLNSNPHYRMMLYHIVVRNQLLPEAKCLKLRVMHAYSRFYCDPPESDGPDAVQYLVSTKQLKLLRESSYQPELDAAAAERLRKLERQYMGAEARDRRSSQSHDWLVSYVKWAEMPEHQDFDNNLRFLRRNMQDYPGMAYMRFPNISTRGKYEVENGHACFGCWFAYELLSNEKYPDRRAASPAPFVFIRDRRLIDRDQLLRTEEVLEHIKKCPGIDALRQELRYGTSQMIPVPWPVLWDV